MPLTRSRSERGAILIFTAIVLLVLVGVAAIAVDLSNAWSNRRRAQAASDVGAVGALQAIPRTFAAGSPVGPIAQDEVQALVDSLTGVNSPGAGTVATISADYLQVTLQVNAVSRNSFARAMGAAATNETGADSVAEIELPEVLDKLVPVGVDNPSGQPYQCMRASLPAYSPPASPPDPTPLVCTSASGLQNRLIQMTGLDPLDCSTSDAATVANIQDGVDHMIDIDTESVRHEADACASGHILTLPNQANRIPLPAGTTLLTQAFGGAGSPLLGADGLWDHLLPAPSGIAQCHESNFNDPTLILEQLSRRMRSCLQSWNASGSKPRIFADSIIGSPRFGFGVDSDSDPADPVIFDDQTLVWFHTIIYDDAALAADPDQDYGQFLSVPGGVGSEIGAVTFYALHPGMLTSGDEAALLPPFGTDLLEFYIID